MDTDKDDDVRRLYPKTCIILARYRNLMDIKEVPEEYFKERQYIFFCHKVLSL